MNIVDSSCWLEFFAGSRVGDEVAPIIEDTENLLVPSITIYEVFKKLLLELDEDKALFAIAHMKQGNVINLDTDVAIYAAKTGKENKLPMADSIIYAINQKYDAMLWTQDKHFKDLKSVHCFEKA
ncbi:PIN domain protein [uncultured spirochete]|jgi:predicted nucleic acid-binding protein|uniref:PIN domain protein n=1 Tax=uncultured spirochete TaxID=156406 RepID=A0A3P3XTB0_9SPIR|nr:PIN domain protein [uncultured spirochete]